MRHIIEGAVRAFLRSKLITSIWQTCGAESPIPGPSPQEIPQAVEVGEVPANLWIGLAPGAAGLNYFYKSRIPAWGFFSSFPYLSRAARSRSPCFSWHSCCNTPHKSRTLRLVACPSRCSAPTPTFWRTWADKFARTSTCFLPSLARNSNLSGMPS